MGQSLQTKQVKYDTLSRTFEEREQELRDTWIKVDQAREAYQKHLEYLIKGI